MSETQTNWTFVSAGAIAVFVLLEVALRPAQGRQMPGWREGAMSYAVISMTLGSVALLAKLAAPVIAGMPRDAQAVVASRAGLLVFLFWLIMFALPGLTGAWSFAASFAILGWVQRPASHPMVPIRNPFAEEFWGLVAAREQLSSSKRVVIWLRHALFGVALVLTSGVGMLMTFGLPKHVLWPYLGVAMVAALLLSPGRSDRRRFARLATPEQPPQMAP